MKVIAPFDASISPPKRFWSTFWKPDVQPEDPATEFETIRRGMVPGAQDVILDQNQAVGGCTVGSKIACAFSAVGHWFVRREVAEREEQAAVMGGFDVLTEKTRLRDALRTRHLRM